MKRYLLFSLTFFLSFAAGIASASPKHDEPSDSRLIPVLVNVNAKGKVTNVAAAYTLRPSFAHSLPEALQKMITKPAMKHGKPVSSQFVLILALVPVAQNNGKSSVNIKYVSSKALPPGTWHWVHTDDHQLALAGRIENTSSPVANRMENRKRIAQIMGLHWMPR